MQTINLTLEELKLCKEIAEDKRLGYSLDIRVAKMRRDESWRGLNNSLDQLKLLEKKYSLLEKLVYKLEKKLKGVQR